MTIRYVTPGDFHAMAEVLAAAFTGDELFGELMNPHREAYPDDYISSFERKIWAHYYDYSRTYLVSVDDTGCILGVAQWQRQGQSGKLAKYDPSA
jgi:hypothetical protein